MNTMKLPASYAMIAEEEMTYLEGGASQSGSVEAAGILLSQENGCTAHNSLLSRTCF